MVDLLGQFKYFSPARREARARMISKIELRSSDGVLIITLLLLFCIFSLTIVASSSCFETSVTCSHRNGYGHRISTGQADKNQATSGENS